MRPGFRLRIGILGAGKIALDHAAAIRALGHEVVAGCSRSSTSPRWQEFQTVAPQARFVGDGRALLEDADVDAVVACLPWDLTPEWLPWLLGSSKPVLIEKPIALNTKTLGAALDRADVVLRNKMVGFNRRFYAPVQRMKERLSRGGLRAAAITVSEAVGRLVERYTEKIIPHILAYSSCHILDAALYLLGPMKPVRVYGRDDHEYPKPFRSFNGLLETASGVPVTLSINADDPVPVGIGCRFDDRTAWVLSPMECLVACRGYEILEPTPEVKVRRYVPKLFFESVADSSSKPGFSEQMRAFTTGEGIEIAATPAESLTLLSLIETLQAAAESNTQAAMISQ